MLTFDKKNKKHLLHIFYSTNDSFSQKEKGHIPLIYLNSLHFTKSNSHNILYSN